MLVGERQRRILEALHNSKNGVISVSELAHAFAVSDMTIRRDLQNLERLGQLRRVYGGAERIASPGRKLLFEARLQVNVPVKRALGKASASLIHPGDSIFFDAGTTILEVARAIPRSLIDRGDLTVITRSLQVATEMRDRRLPNLIVVGGAYVYDFDALGGSLCESAVQAIHVNTAFLGADGITLERGLSTDSVTEAGLYRAMARCADRVVVVADSSKIGVHKLQAILSLDDIHALITDTAAPPAFVRQLRARGIEVTLVPAGPPADPSPAPGEAGENC